MDLVLNTSSVKNKRVSGFSELPPPLNCFAWLGLSYLFLFFHNHNCFCLCGFSFWWSLVLVGWVCLDSDPTVFLSLSVCSGPGCKGAQQVSELQCQWTCSHTRGCITTRPHPASPPEGKTAVGISYVLTILHVGFHMSKMRGLITFSCHVCVKYGTGVRTWLTGSLAHSKFRNMDP